MPVERKQLLYWIWLSLAMGIANRSTSALFDSFGDAYAVYCAGDRELAQIAELPRRTRRALRDKSLSRATHVFDLCEQNGISILTYTEEAFPDVLRTIESPPVLLYYRGNLPDLNRRLCIGMVGTRNMSEYGMHSAYKISYELAAANAVIVSGMALGIDGTCSAGAIAGGGDTVAILGCGVDVLYPKRHRVLRDKICAHGVIMSEYPPAALPLAHHFPERNRLIAGMCQATLAIEGGKKSGALITARAALAEGRAVYALPGDIDRVGSKGMNLLLDEGAHPLLSVQDVLWNYRHTHRSISQEVFESSARVAPDTDLAYLQSVGVLQSKRRTRSADTRAARAAAREDRNTTDAAGQGENAAPRGEALTEELLSSLPPVQAEILRCIAEKGSVLADEMYALPYPYIEISTALTQLEIKRLIKRLPGSRLGLI